MATKDLRFYDNLTGTTVDFLPSVPAVLDLDSLARPAGVLGEVVDLR